MNHSLERRLTRTLGLAVLVIGLVAGSISFMLALQEAQEFQDDTLRQIASLARDEISERRNITSPPIDEYRDPTNQVMLVYLSAKDRGDFSWLSDDLSPGFHTVHGPKSEWRMFVHQDAKGDKIAVAQLTEVRDEAAEDSALHTLAPLGALLLLLALLNSSIIRKQFASVHALAKQLDGHPIDRPYTLEDTDLPDEIVPFINAINRLLRRVSKLMGQQRRFIADAAHELRSPLTALTIQIENLEAVSRNPGIRERIAPLKAGIERSRRLTEQLLTHARSQIAEPEYTTVKLSWWSRNLIAEHLPQADQHKIDLGLDDPGDITIDTDPQTLYLVINNALDNALRYTHPGGTVTMRLAHSEAQLTIEIVDSGPGIPEAEIDRVTNPFFRGDNVSGNGSGLGLAIANDAAVRLGGTITLINRKNQSGLIFRYQQNL